MSIPTASLEENLHEAHDHSVPATTFRDPAGRLYLTSTHALRRINPVAVEETLAFLASPLKAALEANGDLIATEICEPGEMHPSSNGELWLRHPRVDPISYPWEWTTAQWRSAAELTLRVASHAIDAGWTFKDATPLNILFVASRPILVDVLSLERRDPQSRIWLAYGQFVRTFLLPLLAKKLLHWPLQQTLLSRDGYEPSTIYRALQPWQRMKPDVFDVVTLATVFEGRGGGGAAAPTPGGDPELAAHILKRRIARLGKKIQSAAPPEGDSQWSEYNNTASHYTSTDVDEKKLFVRTVLERCHAKDALDIGANTGTFSVIAAESGAKVVAIDNDSSALEAVLRVASAQALPITVLVGNIARPTPAAGWRNREQLSLLDRLTGKFDLVMMLAVIHHLILREQIPLGHIAELCASLTTRWLILEWVPPADPMYQEWLRGRELLYGGLSEEDLKLAFAPFFSVIDRKALGNGRVLFLFERTSVDNARKEAEPA